MRKKSFGRCPFDFDEDVKKIAAINKYIHAKFERHKNKIDNLKGVEQKLMVLHYFNVLNELSNQAIFSLSTGAFSASEVLTRVRVEFYSNHEEWLGGVCGLESEPERGRRCERCFTLRLIAAAKQAQALGIKYFTTTLASSRWKNLDQINQAGLAAEQMVNAQCSMFNEVKFWAQNWRKGGLYERRNQLLKEYQFYNQQYCGCEFSMRPKSTEIKENVKNDE